MRRFWFLIAVGAAAMIVPTAQAGSPTFTPSPPASFTDTTSCGFPVYIQGSAGQTEKDFSNGTTIVTGPLTATFSANGKTITVTIPGPLVAISGHGFYGQGLYGGPLQLPNGETLAIAAGTVDVSGFPAVLVHGTVVLNLCTALAP
jgi:hypothetical protein